MEREEYNPAAKELDSRIKEACSWIEDLLKRDKTIDRQDTAAAVIQCMESMRGAMEKVLQASDNIKEAAYWALLNGTIEIFKYCRLLRKSHFARDTSKYLAWCMLCMESNIVLTSSKHLTWRITLYTEIIEVYEHIGAFKSANKVVFHALKQIQGLKEIEEAEPPVPDVIKNNLAIATEHFKALEMKFGLLLGTMPPDQWKKKLDEFPLKSTKLAIALRCLSLNKPDCSRKVQQQGLKVPWKAIVTTYAVDLVSADLQTLCKALNEQKEKRTRDSRLLEMSLKNDSGENKESVLVKNREFDSQMVKEAVWRKACSNVPLEIHLELLKHAYDCRLWDIFSNLSDWAEVRISNRRIEHPYVTDVDIMYSSMPDSKIPKGFEKIDIDLNYAHLRSEMARLGIKDPDKKPEEGKKEDAKKPPDPKAKGKTGAAPQSKQPEIPIELPPVVIDHSYVYLVQKKGENEEGAMNSFEIKMADAKNGPNITPGQKAVAIPIEQFNKDNGKVPYMVVSKQTPENDEGRLNLIIDVQVLLSKHPDVKPPEGYTKINFDLRGTPADAERFPNNTNVYICYRTEETLQVLIREFYTLFTLRKLEQSKDSTDMEKIPKMDKHFLLNWDLALLHNFTVRLNSSIHGYVGNYFCKNSPDILVDTCLKIWESFILPIFKAKSTAFERFFQNEIEDYVISRWPEIRSGLIDCLEVIFRILGSKVDSQDTITVLNIGQTLALLQEEAESYRYAVQTLRSTLNIIIEIREKIFRRGIKAEDDKDFPACITVDPENLKKIRQDWKSSCLKWEHQVAAALRNATRKKTLDDDEALEEENEVLVKIKEKDRLAEEDKEFNKTPPIPEVEIILHNMHAEILANLYRNELKLDKSSSEEQSDTKKSFKGLKPSLTKGLSSGITAKLGLSKGKTATKIRKDTQQLQETLQAAGKLPPKKPLPNFTEKLLITENGKNPYQQALLYLQMALFKINPQEQKSLLKDAMKYIEESEEMEKNMWNEVVSSAAEIQASRYFSFLGGGSSHLDVYPYLHIADSSLVKSLNCPPKPTIISRTSTTITVKLPFFKPKIVDKFNIKTVSSIALFGKEARSGTSVSLTNFEFEGLNVKHSFDDIITLNNLTPFESYHFAAAGFTDDGECIGGIGETCETVITLFPLHVPLLWSYLAENAFTLNHPMIAVKCVERVLGHYVESNFTSHLLQSRLNLKKLYSATGAELRHMVKSIIIYVECMLLSESQKLKLKLLRDPAYRPLLVLDKQQREHKLANLMILALELAVITQNAVCIKSCVHHIFNLIHKQFHVEANPSYLLHLLARTYSCLQAVPSELWDSGFRRVSAVLSSLYFKYFLSSGQAKLVATLNTKLPMFKWTIENNACILKESEAFALYEMTLQHIELQDISKSLNEKMKESLQLLTGGEEHKTPSRKLLDDLNEVWNGIKNSADCGFIKINSTYKDNPHYLEFICKCLWGMIDKGVSPDTVFQNTVQVIPPALPGLAEEISHITTSLDLDKTPLTGVPEFQQDNRDLLLWASEWFLLQGSLLFIKKCPRKIEENKGSFFIKTMDVGSLIKDSGKSAEELDVVFAELMRSAKCAQKTKSWKQLENVAISVWNILNSALPSPSNLVHSSSWKYIVSIAEDCLSLLEAQKYPETAETSRKMVSFEDGHKEEKIGEVAWFLTRNDVKINLFANIIGFAIQCLLVAEKWEYLQYLCFRMNIATSHYFAGTVLPFGIYAERALHERSQQSRVSRENDLAKRIEMYENWKATNKKRKSRQALITGEVPKEQLEFEADCREIQGSIEEKKNKEKELLEKIKTSETALDDIKKGASNAEESLIQSRKLLEQYGKEARNLQLEPMDNALKAKKRAHKVFANMVISSYKKTVELLRKRQEKWLLAQALNELADLSFSEGNLEEAETFWNDSVDTVFQSLYLLQNFRRVFLLGDDSNWRTQENLAEKYTLKGCFLAGIVCYKLARLIYECKSLRNHRNCLVLGKLLMSSVFRLSLPHPEHPVYMSLYRMREITPYVNLYDISMEISLSDLALACEYISVCIIDRGLWADALPVLTLLEFISSEYLWNASLTAKARLWKSIALAHIGYPDYACFMLQKVVSLKDLPKPGSRRHLFRDKEHQFYRPKTRYNQSQPPEFQANTDFIQTINKLDIPLGLVTETSLYTYSLAVYAKYNILYFLTKTENIDNLNSEGLRNAVHPEIEKNLRILLKNLCYEDEVSRIKATHEDEGNVEEYVKARIGSIEMQDVPLRDVIIANFFKNEESISDGEIKVRRLELIMRARLLLSNLKQAQGELSVAVKIIKQALINFSGFAEGRYNTELGIEQYFNPPEKVEEVKKEVPAKKGAKETVAIVPDTNKEQKLKELQEFLSKWEYRNSLGFYFWLKLKYRLSELFYLQSRYSEALTYAQSLRVEACKVFEDYYERLSFEIEGYVLMRQGNLEGTIDMMEKVRSIGEGFFYGDPEFSISLGNYAMFLYERGHYTPAFENITLSRQKIRGYMEKAGFVNKAIDINKDINVKQVLIIRPGKDESKAVDPKDKGRSKTPERSEKPQFKDDIISANVEAEANSGLIPPNIYINYLEVAVKIELYYAECFVTEDYNNERISEIIENVLEAEEISNKIVHLNPSVLVNIQYLKSRLYRYKFIKSIWDFQETYRMKAKDKRKYRKLSEKYPDYSLASGKTLLHLPNFSHKLAEEWLPLLDKSKESCEKAIQLVAKESILNSPHLLFLDLYQTLILQREYRPRIGYKYLSNPGDTSKGEVPYEDLLKQDAAKVHKTTKELLKAISLSIELFNTKENVKHQFSQFTIGQITDINKVPKIITQEILESDYLQKKKYSAGLFEESKKKTTINALDVITYLIKHSSDLNNLALGREWRESRTLKLHRVLNTICPQYATKCKFVWDLVVQPAPTDELIPVGTVMGFWDKRRASTGEIMQYFSYICAPMDTVNLIQRENHDDDEQVIEFSKKDLYLYGEVRVNEYFVSNLAQNLKDLKDKVKKSATFSKEKCERDNRKYAEELKKHLFDIATIFCPELSQINKDSATAKRDNVNKVIATLLPIINEEKINFLASLFWVGGFNFKEANISAILRNFHSLRYLG